MSESMTEKKRNDVKMATIYKIRLTVSQIEKKDYTKEEVLQLLDTIAITKDQK